MRASPLVHPYRLLWLLAVAALATSCDSPGPLSVALAPYLSVAPPIVASDAILPPPPRMPDELANSDSSPRESTAPRSRRPMTTGLHAVRRRDSNEPSLWRVGGTAAEVRFRLVSTEDTLLRMQIRPYSKGPDAEREMSVWLNGSELRQLVLVPHWATVEVDLPGAQLRLGSNRLQLQFSHAVPLPGAGGHRARSSAARLRSLQIVSPLGRSPWPRGAPTVQAAEPLLMPTDSLIQIALLVPAGAHLRADISALPVNSERPAAMHALIEVVDREGNTSSGHQLFEAHFKAPQKPSSRAPEGPLREASGEARPAPQDRPPRNALDEARPTPQDGPPRDASDGSRPEPGDGPGQLDVSLEPWSGQRILLRFRSTGDVNGMVSWKHLRLEYHARRSAPDPVLGARAPDLQPAPRSGRWDTPDVLVILLDAARADAFSPYGAQRPTPNVQALAEAGTVVARALSPAPWTAPAVTSLLTGWWPDAHGVESWTAPLQESISTLPEMLADAGYHTVLWSHHVLWRGNRSLRRGFERIVEVRHMDRERVPSATELFAPGRPTFALVHLVLPHQPYEPPPPYRGRFTQDNRDVSSLALRRLRDMDTAGASASEVIRVARDRYDETVAWTDSKVGELLEVVRSAGRFDDALIVLVADHGEGFYEHGAFLHTRLVYEEMLRVPMIFKWPRSSLVHPASFPGPASLIDLAPTLVDGLGICARAQFQGRSLLPQMFDQRAADDQPLYARTAGSRNNSSPAQPKTALEFGDYKLVFDPAGPGPELYDLTSDPGEQRNLARERPILTRWLLQRLLARHNRNALLRGGTGGSSTASGLDPKALRALRALGYVQ